MMLVLSVVETAGISVIMPFISLASNPDLLSSGLYQRIYNLLGFTSPMQCIMIFGACIIAFNFFRAAYTVFYNYILNRFSFGLFRDLSLRLLNTYLRVPYRVFVMKNSAELIDIINGRVSDVSSLVLNILQMGAEFFTVLMLYAFMVAVDPRMTLVLTVLLLVAVFFILRFLVKYAKQQGAMRSKSRRRMFRILGETFGNFKFIKLKGNEKAVKSSYEKQAQESSHAHVMNATLNVMPRTILEGLGFSLLIGAVMVILWQYQSAARVIPIISMYALALYRILPAVNRLLGNINQVTYLRLSLDIVDEHIHQTVEIDGDEGLSFERGIRAEHLSFGYMTGGEVLHDVSLEIGKGEKVAITGESGGGKSTLVDVLIGIHRPDSGTIFVDDIPLDAGNIRAWRSKIGYIPQDIYLTDGTVGENVAFGAVYEEERVIDVLKMANIWDFLLTKEGLATKVGEGGIQLSGGQRQRIGIARALYSDPDLLVLDEATSALDNHTEKRIMDEIYSVARGKTLIVIAHRLSTVERCDRRITIEQGRIV
jgi:ATP-binding cassette subfamily B protein/ATP-binding cassette subfamily C protein